MRSSSSRSLPRSQPWEVLRWSCRGGAQAKNVFWQVGSSATLGTNSIFKGTILALQAITLDTGASLQGRALARNAAVTFDSNTVTAP